MTLHKSTTPEWLAEYIDFGGVQVDKFYTRMSDKQGHHQNIASSVRVPQDWANRMGMIVASKFTPYESTIEFVRDACFHRLYQLWEMLHDVDADGIPCETNEDDRQFFILAEAARQRSAEVRNDKAQREQVSEAEASYQELWQTKAYASLGKLLDMDWNLLAEWSEPYRTQMRAVVERYHTMLQTTGWKPDPDLFG